MKDDTIKIQDERYNKRIQELIDHEGLSIKEMVMISNGYITKEELKKRLKELSLKKKPRKEK